MRLSDRPFAVARVAYSVALLVMVALCASSSFAQSQFGQPIYPGYQGFIENPDGSVTVVFQYFSHGRDSVTLPIGPANHFTGVEDRNQPTLFLPGNHENVCVMVVNSRREAEELRWSLTFPSEESATSNDPLNAEYMLEERSQKEANRGIDYATVPRGVCLNKAPKIFANGRRFGSAADEIPEVSATVGKALELKGQISDEGLPRGSSITATWRKASGPGDATFTEVNAAHTHVTFDSSGTYLLDLHATDGELEATDRIRVVVEPGGA